MALDGHTHHEELELFGLRRWELIGLVAAGLTACGPLWPENAVTFIATLPLSFGVLFAGVFFGGLHNNPPVVPVFALASVFNAAVFGGAFRLTRWGLRPLGRSIKSAIDIY